MNGERTVVGVASAARAVLFGVGLGVSTTLRLAHLFPNKDPIMAVMLPYAKRGRVAAVAFPVAAMLLFDLLAQQVDIWTLVTAGNYGLIGLGFSFLYGAFSRRGRRVTRMTYVVSGIAGALVRRD